MKKSPSVEIYKFPITALTSITTRVTGLALTGCFISAGVYTLVKPTDSFQIKDPNLKQIVDYTILFPTCYHSLGGIRHFIWELCLGFLILKNH